jgi:hypothetical protein
VTPLRLIETEPDRFSLLLDAGDTPVEEVVAELGHEANGYFWEGVAQLLVRTHAPELAGRFDYDPEGGMFCAYGEDREALEKLGSMMSEVATDAVRIRGLITEAEDAGFEFDD